MSFNPFLLTGKTIFVTGASSGIGKAVSIECSKMGAHLIITGRNSTKLNETFSMLEGKGHKQIVADLTGDNVIKILIEKTDQMDGIVHCAGIVKPLPFQFSGESVIYEVMSINFTAPAILSQQLVKSKKINKGGSIVFISSISGVVCSSAGGSIYSASKGAINGLVKGMAIDLAPKMIRVNTINPGMIDTGIFDRGTLSDDQLKEDMHRYPFKRFGKPEEVAYLVIYLLSDASSWVTGSSFVIDGGYTLL